MQIEATGSKTIKNSEDGGQGQANAENSLIPFENALAHVQNHDGDYDGVEHADDGNGEFDNVIQAEIGHYQAKEANIHAEALIKHTTTAELVKIAANGGGQTDGGGDAGEENNQSQNHLTGEAHVMDADHVQELAAVGHNAKGSGADSACIGQCTVN